MKIQVIKATEELVRQEGVRYCGVEVAAGSTCLKSLDANVDPQHGGGIFGFHHLPCLSRVASAAYTAWFLKTQRAADGVVGADTIFVTTRLDPDSLVAAGILGDEFSAEELEAMYDEVKHLRQLDTGTMYDSWSPEFRVQTVGDDPQWGPLAALCMQYPRVSLETLVASVQHICCGADAPAEYIAAHAAHAAAWQRVQSDILPRVTRVGSLIARGVDLPFVSGSGAMAAAYAIAPVAALSVTFQGKRKHTLAVANGWVHGAEVIRQFKCHVDTNESGWGGSNSIIGSPFAGTNVPDDVFEQMVLHAVRLAVGTV